MKVKSQRKKKEEKVEKVIEVIQKNHDVSKCLKESQTFEEV